jgi:hypothetical protein
MSLDLPVQILWNNNGNHDKIWGFIQLTVRDKPIFVTFWGRRGNKLSIKGFGPIFPYQIYLMSSTKVKDGYHEVINWKSLYPGIEEDIEKLTLKAKLKYC